MTDLKLRRCPFCGNKPSIMIRAYTCSCGNDSHKIISIECNQCHSRSDQYKLKVEARTAWNKRSK